MEIEEYLKGFSKFTKEPSLKAMEWLMGEFGNPQNQLQIIHVAGTNGKGSVCEMLNSIFIQAGYRVGKFISPHLITFNETICVSGQPIPDKEVQEILIPLSEKIEEYNLKHEIKVTWFEVITSLAFIYFAKKQCEIVVLETGMGGRQDCTNIVQADISIITSIGYDHKEVLGNTLEEIAKNKAGIIKEKGDTIFLKQEDTIQSILEEEATQKHNTIHAISQKELTNYHFDEKKQYFTYGNYQDIEVNLKGRKQIENASICLECVEVMKKKGYEISEQAIRNGLKTVIHPTILFDGGHNENAIQHFNQMVDQYYLKPKKTYVISILETKDYRTVLRLLLHDKEARYIVTSGNSKQYFSKEQLYEEAKRYGVTLEKMELQEATKIIQDLPKEEVGFFVGSFYIYADVLKLLGK